MFAALNLDGRSRLAMGEIVTGNYFQVFGVGAALGRTICPTTTGRARRASAMVSHRYWTRELGVGAAMRSAATLRIRGNAVHDRRRRAARRSTAWCRCSRPRCGFRSPASLDVEPVGMHDAVPSPTGTTRLERRADRWLFMRGRLKPGRDDRRRRART